MPDSIGLRSSLRSVSDRQAGRGEAVDALTQQLGRRSVFALGAYSRSFTGDPVTISNLSSGPPSTGNLRQQLDAVTAESMRQRRGAKWGRYRGPVLAAWVADMDFPVAPAVRRVLTEMVEQSDFGYPFLPIPVELVEVFAARMKARYDLEVRTEWVAPLVTVIQGFDLCIDRLSNPGDGVIVQTPIYPPFLASVRGNERRLIENPLVRSGVRGDDRYEIDFDHLESVIDSGTRMLMLCNPHNPTGRVFERPELERLAEIANANDLIILADEIHADLTYEGSEHISIATLSPEIAQRTVTLTSATKSFNLAGLPCAFAAFGSEKLHRKLESVPPFLLAHPGALGIQATLAAWTEGEEWLGEVRRYLEENRALLGEFLARRLPEIVYRPPEATYLTWLDCRQLVGHSIGRNLRPSRFFFKKAKVALTCGHDFGDPGAGFVRLNIATSRSVLEQILERMASSLETAQD